VTAEAVTAETKRLMERRTTTLRERAEMAEAAVAELAQALRLTREYVGEDLLPAVEGWSWYDALRRHAPRELGDTPELTPQAAAVHRAFVEAADSPRAQLDEQARAHAIEIAELKRRNTNQADTVRDMARINREAHERVRVADFHAADAKERARVAETELATLREGIRECGGNPTNVQNLAAQMRMWRRRFERAEHRATRYRTAWFAARRDRRADRAAMAAELPLVEAGQQARTEAALAEQRLAAVLAALPTEPRPRLGLPNDLAYTDGQHDQADAIRDALAQH
jgi:hypothetical protein